MEQKTEVKQSARIQTSILNAAEKKVLVWMGERMPSWVTSDMLTYFGTFGAIVIALGYYLTNFNIAWLWLASFGFVLNWFGDSLDGTLARVRKQQRPLYGFYIDHNIDVINEAFMIGGAGLSCLMDLRIALLVLCAYFMISIYVYINAHLKGEFKLTYAKLGPTELRLIIIIVNTLFFFIRPLQTFCLSLTVLGKNLDLKALDIVGLALFVGIICAYLASLYNDGRYFAKLDPLKKKAE